MRDVNTVYPLFLSWYQTQTEVLILIELSIGVLQSANEPESDMYILYYILHTYAYTGIYSTAKTALTMKHSGFWHYNNVESTRVVG
jgi:hypothetical protein